MSKLSYRAPALDKGLDIIELLALSAEGLTQAQTQRLYSIYLLRRFKDP